MHGAGDGGALMGAYAAGTSYKASDANAAVTSAPRTSHATLGPASASAASPILDGHCPPPGHGGTKTYSAERVADAAPSNLDLLAKLSMHSPQMSKRTRDDDAKPSAALLSAASTAPNRLACGPSVAADGAAGNAPAALSSGVSGQGASPGEQLAASSDNAYSVTVPNGAAPLPFVRTNHRWPPPQTGSGRHVTTTSSSGL